MAAENTVSMDRPSLVPDRPDESSELEFGAVR